MERVEHATYEYGEKEVFIADVYIFKDDDSAQRGISSLPLRLHARHNGQPIRACRYHSVSMISHHSPSVSGNSVKFIRP